MKSQPQIPGGTRERARVPAPAPIPRGGGFAARSSQPPQADSMKTLPSRPAAPQTQTTSDAGTTVYCLLRWVNTRAEKGPWSAAASATIA